VTVARLVLIRKVAVICFQTAFLGVTRFLLRVPGDMFGFDAIVTLT